MLQKRAHILAALLADDEGFCSIPVESIHPSTLERMLLLYDTAFLGGYLREKMPKIKLSLSSRLTSCAGKFVYQKGLFGQIHDAEIRMSSDFLFRLSSGPFSLNGLQAATPQEAFLIVFEHELCHALETALYGQTGHSSRFLALANGLFGHTKTRHSLPTRKHEAAQNGLTVGMRASFDYQGKILAGVIHYIGKTATVMVPSVQGEYHDSRGRRYSKYRVPLSALRRMR